MGSGGAAAPKLFQPGLFNSTRDRRAATTAADSHEGKGHEMSTENEIKVKRTPGPDILPKIVRSFQTRFCWEKTWTWVWSLVLYNNSNTDASLNSLYTLCFRDDRDTQQICVCVCVVTFACVTKSALGIFVHFRLIRKITTIASNLLRGAHWQPSDRYRSETQMLVIFVVYFYKPDQTEVSFRL